MRKTMAIVLATLMVALLWTPANAEYFHEYMGSPMEDFTVETIDGGHFTLSEALRDHDMVLINFWATWCVYCVREFPFLQQAYEEYADRVAVIALSCEPDDTVEVMRGFAEENGLTFPIANEGELGLSDVYGRYGIPCSVAVDRFGNVAFAQIGAQPNADAFYWLFDYFTDDGYTETKVLTEIPRAVSKATPADEAALSDAANAAGGTLAFFNPDAREAWPMLPEALDGRTALVSANAGVDASSAAVSARLSAAPGDALAFAFRTSTEAAADALFVRVDGVTVKRFSGDHDWTEWALPLEAGEHEIALGYEKDDLAAEGEDKVWIDDVRVASGDAAAELLAALPANPTGEAFDVRLVAAQAREIAFEPAQVVFGDLSDARAYVIPGDAAVARIIPAEGDDPEMAFLYTNRSDRISKLADYLNEAGDAYECPVQLTGGEAGDAVYTALYAYPGANATDRVALRVTFPSESDVDAFLEGSGVSWRFVE